MEDVILHFEFFIVYLDYELLAKQTEYTRYIADSAELQGVNLSVLGKREKSMFFLNVYQVN